MVHHAAPANKPAAVKREADDPSDELRHLAHKRSKLEWGEGASMVSLLPMPYNPLDEPSPLGLRLKKSPSLLDLIQMRISQASSAAKSCVLSCENPDVEKRKDLKPSAISAISDKMKASNFPVSLLRIGTWECISRYEGDLVAKCYFAKHKLVWEVLEGGLKSKLEIQWSDITALKATCPEKGPSTLDIVLARQPLFFRETNPQPRKHTLWQATEDFTGGQASLHRKHSLECPQGLLSKHFEKLIQCDPRLHSLSQQPDMMLNSLYFEPRCSVFEGQDESKSCCFNNSNDDCESKISGLHDQLSPSGASLSSNVIEQGDPPTDRASCLVPKGAFSSCSVMDSRTVNGNTSSVAELRNHNHMDQFKVKGLRASMSVSDLVSHIGHCISEQMNAGNPHLSDDGIPNKSMLEEIAQHLFSDSQLSATDEKSLMSRVNSFCCLLQKDSSAVQNLHVSDSDSEIDDDDKEPVPTLESNSNIKTVNDCVPEEEFHDSSVSKQLPRISRKDSFGELLMHLPRIASLPQFFFNISEDSEDQTK